MSKATWCSRLIDKSLDRNKAKKWCSIPFCVSLNQQVLSKISRSVVRRHAPESKHHSILMFDPDLLLLDEPFSALNYYTKLIWRKNSASWCGEKTSPAILYTWYWRGRSMGSRFHYDGGKLAKGVPNQRRNNTAKPSRTAESLWLEAVKNLPSTMWNLVGNWINH